MNQNTQGNSHKDCRTTWDMECMTPTIHFLKDILKLCFLHLSLSQKAQIWFKERKFWVEVNDKAGKILYFCYFQQIP